MTQGRWEVADPAALVRLRTNRVGLVAVDATAPIRRGTITITDQACTLDMVLALDQIGTSFLLQRAARALLSAHRVVDLFYLATGAGGSAPWQVRGDAVAGDVTVDLAVDLTPLDSQQEAMTRVELRGFAGLGPVELPLPGLGRTDDLQVTLDCVLAVRPIH